MGCHHRAQAQDTEDRLSTSTQEGHGGGRRTERTHIAYVLYQGSEEKRRSGWHGNNVEEAGVWRRGGEGWEEGERGEWREVEAA